MSELTSEEKRKIYLEEKERMEAREQLKSPAKKSRMGNIIALAGSVLLCIGLFLPWATIGLVSADGFRKLGGDATLLLVVGAVCGLTSLIGILSEKSYGMVSVILGLLGFAYLFFVYFQLSANLSGEVFGVSPSIGAGFWLCCVGAIVTAIGGIMVVQSKKQK